jgi:hypothetical protein
MQILIFYFTFWEMDLAGFQLSSPICTAVKVAVPFPMMFAVVTAMDITFVLLLRSFTVSSDVAVASSAKLLSPTRSGDSGWKAIV